MRPLSRMVLAMIFLAGFDSASADDKAAEALRDHLPQPGIFPPAKAGIHLDGDLVFSDPINRRGALRKWPGSAHRPSSALLVLK